MSSDIIILNNELLNELIFTNSLNLSIKFQKKCTNFFFIPNIGLKLYNPYITWIDPFKKYISFSFKKSDNIFLSHLLKNINTKLQELYIKNSRNPQSLASFYFENKEYIYIRTYLPKTSNKYNINCIYNSEKVDFVIPRLKTSFKYIILHLRNIWEDNSKSAYHIELKMVEN